jgi:hypothetical protein
MQGLKKINQAEILTLSELHIHTCQEQYEASILTAGSLKDPSHLVLPDGLKGPTTWHHIRVDLNLHVRRRYVGVQMYCSAF